MAQAQRITKETAVREELALEGLIEALKDGVFCEVEQSNVIRILLESLVW